jgi:hypothetical protein
MARQAVPATILTAAVLVLAGCAKREIMLVEPAEFAQIISRKEQAVIAQEPVEYRLREYDGRLLMRIDNPPDGEQPVTLLGERSYVVDPSGESHRLRGGTLAPASYMIVEVPPVFYPYYYGPRVGFGFGTSFNHRCFVDDGFYGAGVGYAVGGGYPRWKWKEGEVRLRLVYDHGPGTEPVEHTFLFVRRKVE